MQNFITDGVNVNLVLNLEIRYYSQPISQKMTDWQLADRSVVCCDIDWN